MSRGSFVALLLSVLILFLVYSYLKDQLTDDTSDARVSSLDEAVAARCLANQRALKTAVAAYKVAHSGCLPTVLEELVPRFLSAIPNCPSGAPYEYDAQSGGVFCSEGHGK